MIEWRQWRPFRDHTDGGEYADWEADRDGMARPHSVDSTNVCWYEVIYDDPDKNGREPSYLQQHDIELLN